METLERNPTETYLTFDHDRNVVYGWTNYRHTIAAWLKQFPDYCEVKQSCGEKTVTMNNVPIDNFRKPTDLKRKRQNLTQEQRDKVRDRLAASRSSS